MDGSATHRCTAVSELPRHPHRPSVGARHGMCHLPSDSGAGRQPARGACRPLPGSALAPRSRLRPASPGIRNLRHLPCPRLLHHVSRECARDPGDPGARARRALPRDRDETRGTTRSCVTRVREPAREAGTKRPGKLRDVPHAGELPHLSRHPADRGRGIARRRTRPRPRRDSAATKAGVARRRLHRPARRAGRGLTEELRRLPCPRGLPRLPPAERRLGPGLPPRRLPRAPSGLRLRARNHLRRVPQHRLVLRRLPPAVRPRRTGEPPRRISRREAGIPLCAWPRRQAEPGELRLVPRRARLSHVSLRDRWPPVQPARSGFRC